MKSLRILGLSLALFGAGLSTVLAAAAASKAAKPEHISRGAKVELKDYMVAGKTTVFDFTSEFCPPCRAVAPRLEKLHETRDDVVVVKVDINRPNIKGIDWNSPVAKQFGLQSIPHFKVYGPDGKLVAEGKTATSLVYGWLK